MALKEKIRKCVVCLNRYELNENNFNKAHRKNGFELNCINCIDKERKPICLDCHKEYECFDGNFKKYTTCYETYCLTCQQIRCDEILPTDEFIIVKASEADLTKKFGWPRWNLNIAFCGNDCGKVKPLSEFNRCDDNDVNNLRPRSECQECAIRHRKERWQENREEILAENKQWRLDHPDDGKEYRRQYRLKNAEAIKESNRLYREKHKGEFKLYYQMIKNDPVLWTEWQKDCKEYREKNKVRLREGKKKYRKQRMENDPCFRLRINLSRSIGGALKNRGSSKEEMSILECLPYTIAELKAHLESLFEPWMNWKNYGKYKVEGWDDNDETTWKWNLDHEQPHSEFYYESMTDESFLKCWALSNLRPYNAKQNLLDGVNGIRHNKEFDMINENNL